MVGRRRLPLHTWVGAAILAAVELGVRLRQPLAATWLTPAAWTGYILFVDGLVARASGRSWLTNRRREFPFLVLASVGIWLLFEAYNLHLRNWFYTGLPESPWLRDLGYGWSFATILPGVFETTDLVALMMGRPMEWNARGEVMSAPLRRAIWVLGGLALVLIPLALPSDVARYLFGAVWLGFFFLIDPINEQLGAPSLASSWRFGRRSPIVSLLLAGGLCGFLWETWNFQAFGAGGAHWVYAVPDELRVFGLHFGKMPLLGLLGFPPFALELFALYNALKSVLGMEQSIGKDGS
jgi:hypothetical protein